MKIEWGKNKMVDVYKISIENLKKAGIEAKEGTHITLQVSKDNAIRAVITKVEKDHVIATPVQPKK